MIRPLVTGAMFGLGVWLLLRGLFPPRLTLKEHLARFNEMPVERGPESVARTVLERPALWLLRTVKSGMLDDIEADVAITGGRVADIAVDKLKTAAGAALLAPIVLFLTGLSRSAPVFAAFAAMGLMVGYLLPDIELRQKAAARRREFTAVLTGFVGLVAVSISGGGGLNTAMADTTRIGDGWCFERLRETLDEAQLAGESPWSALERLGRHLKVIPLVELAGALSLAGASGARVVETLRARADAGRERELAEALTEAKKKSESMSIPVAAMLLGWIGFLGYPAVANLVGS